MVDVGGASYQTIRLEHEEEIAWLVLDRPRVLNALSGPMLRELLDALERIPGTGARALVVRGEGRSFCAGADLRSLPEDVDLTDVADIRRHMRGWRDVVMGIRSLPIPSIAAVAGHAYGGGLNLALACDIVIAAESARLCQSYIDRGVPTDLGGSYVFPRLVGLGQARRMLLTGDVVDGVTAEHMGLVGAVVQDEMLLSEARALAKSLAAKDPSAVVAMRDLLDRGVVGTLVEALDREGDAVAALLSDPAVLEKLNSYRKR